MNNLFQSQIRESCALSLPEGLKDLMSDISREVLRAQPQNLYRFIANYLEALLEARQALTIACHVCQQTCECICEPELENELRVIGLDDEDVQNAVEIIIDHLKNGPVDEKHLFLKLIKKTNIDKDQVICIHDAIQRAFKRHLIKKSKEAKESNEEVVKAAQHTIQRYGNCKNEENKNISPQHDNRTDCASTSTDSRTNQHVVGFTRENLILAKTEDCDTLSSADSYKTSEDVDNYENGFDDNNDKESLNLDGNENNDSNDGEEVAEELVETKENSIVSSIDESLSDDEDDEDDDGLK